MRILFLSRWFPYPPTNGAKLRVFNLLRLLARRHEVTLISFADLPNENAEAPAIRAICQSVDTIAWESSPTHGPRSCFHLLGPTPRSVVETFSSRMEQRIREALSQKRHDLVIASQLTSAGYAAAFRRVPALFEEVELAVMYEQFARASSPATRLRHGLTWAKHRRYLARLLSDFRACTVASEPERELLARAVPTHPPVTVIPNCVDVAAYDCSGASPHPDSLIFTGSLGYGPNYDAMRWFLERIYPAVRAARPAVRLTITGDPAGRELPPEANVLQTGFVDDIRPLVRSSRLSLAPIREGGGTRVKILESLALGTPVVATSKGTEGLEVRNGEHLLIADDPHAFAGCVIALLEDDALRARLSLNGRRLVEDRYDWTLVEARLEELLRRVRGSRVSPPRISPETTG